MVDSVLKRDFESMAKSLVDPTRVISVDHNQWRHNFYRSASRYINLPVTEA